jgi:hypothetical protein
MELKFEQIKWKSRENFVYPLYRRTGKIRPWYLPQCEIKIFSRLFQDFFSRKARMKNLTLDRNVNKHATAVRSSFL